MMRAELRDSLENLYADSRVRARPRSRLHLDMARGGTIAVHVLVNEASEGQSLNVTARERGRASKVRHGSA